MAAKKVNKAIGKRNKKPAKVNKTKKDATPKEITKVVESSKTKKIKSNGYKQLGEKHREFIREYVARVLPDHSTIYSIYMEVYGWDEKHKRSESKKKQAAVLANKIINTPGATEYMKGLQEQITKEAEQSKVVRPIMEDLLILEQIIDHNVNGYEVREQNVDGEKVVTSKSRNIDKVSKQHAIIRAIEAKAKIMGESRIRLIGANEKVTLSSDGINARLDALMKKANKKEA